MNKLLQQQLKKHFGAAGQVPENTIQLLNDISDSYDHFEKDQIFFKHSVELNSNNEAALRESKRRLRQIIDLVPHFIFAKDTKGKFILVNEAVAKTYGSTVEALIGKSDVDFNSNKEEVEHFMQEDLEVINKGIAKYNTEETVTDSTGNTRVLSTTKIPYTYPGDEKPGILGVSVDISEHKKAEKKLKESEVHYRTLIEQASDTIVIFDRSSKFIDINLIGCQLLGYTKEEFLQLSFTDLLQSEDLISNPLRIEELKSGKRVINERRIKRKDGKLLEIEVCSKMLGDGSIIMFSRDISERKKAEKILKESESQLSIAMKIAKLGYWEFDVLKGQFTFNDQFYSIFKTTAEKEGGYTMTPENYTGKFVYPDDIEIVSLEVAKAINSLDANYTRNLEHRIIYATGEIGWISVNLYLVKNQEGQTIKTYGVNQDITQQKNAEQSIINSEETRKLIMNSALDAIVGMDTKGCITVWTPQAEKIFGWNEKEVMGKVMADYIIPQSYRERHKQGLERYLQTGKETILNKLNELSALNKEGKEFPIEISILPIQQGDKKFFCSFIRDITDRKKSEAAIRRSEERYRQIVETAQEGIWLIDENDLTTFVNKKMAEILEYSIEEMMGKKNYFFMDEDGKKEARQQIERRKLGVEENHDFKYISKSGRNVWTNLSTNPIFDEKGKYKGALAMVTDITQRKFQEDLLQKSEIDLEIKNKLLEQKNKELEQFAYVASHDMQEPLRTTSSFVELLQQQYKGKLDEKADKYLTFIAQSSDRMKVLIKDLLDYSRIGRKRDLEIINCNTVLNEILADLGTAINESSAQITTGKLPVISGYSTEIKQLFLNLIMNAIKFRKKNIAPQINITVQKVKNSWQFAIKDNGIGIEEQYNERIFIIFQRLHNRNEYNGSGIGLSHCKKIVELHKGKIWVVSAPGKGSTFYFTIQENIIE